jgi:hypothetical protein
LIKGSSEVNEPVTVHIQHFLRAFQHPSALSLDIDIQGYGMGRNLDKASDML